jgi:hypothetical protein
METRLHSMTLTFVVLPVRPFRELLLEAVRAAFMRWGQPCALAMNLAAAWFVYPGAIGLLNAAVAGWLAAAWLYQLTD